MDASMFLTYLLFRFEVYKLTGTKVPRLTESVIHLLRSICRPPPGLFLLRVATFEVDLPANGENATSAIDTGNCYTPEALNMYPRC